jgi:hypothetical protein
LYSIVKDFSAITGHIEQTISDCMRTPADFASLAAHNTYKEQLCYIYWLVEDKLNDIGYVETLYPSTRALSEAQPAYAAPQFDSTAKTLVLWYKMMSDLMTRSDDLGRFLGFTRKAEYKANWPWFHDGLQYTRDEYLKTHSRIETWIEQQSLNNSLSYSSMSSNTTYCPPVSNRVPLPTHHESSPGIQQSETRLEIQI